MGCRKPGGVWCAVLRRELRWFKGWECCCNPPLVRASYEKDTVVLWGLCICTVTRAQVERAKIP